MRKILALPFLIFGLCFFYLAEFIGGEKVTFRGKEILNILECTAECTQCGHKGAVFYKKP